VTDTTTGTVLNCYHRAQLEKNGSSSITASCLRYNRIIYSEIRILSDLCKIYHKQCCNAIVNCLRKKLQEASVKNAWNLAEKGRRVPRALVRPCLTLLSSSRVIPHLTRLPSQSAFDVNLCDENDLACLSSASEISSQVGSLIHNSHSRVCQPKSRSPKLP